MRIISVRVTFLGVVLSSVGGWGSDACGLGTHGDVYLVEWIFRMDLSGNVYLEEWIRCMICILLENVLDL